jgi:hypothetical protein
MSKPQLLDAYGDIIETMQYDESTGKTYVKKTQDVEPYLDDIARQRNQAETGWKGDLHKVATVPMVIIDQWNKELNCNVLLKENRHLLMLKLNSPEYSKLRTKTGRI